MNALATPTSLARLGVSLHKTLRVDRVEAEDLVRGVGMGRGHISGAPWLPLHSYVARDLVTRRIVGCGAFQVVAPGIAWVCTIAVAPSHRDRGLGSTIVRRVLVSAAARASTRAWLETELDKRGFYERLGFYAVADADAPDGPRGYRNEAHALLMRRDLSGATVLTDDTEWA